MSCSEVATGTASSTAAAAGAVSCASSSAAYAYAWNDYRLEECLDSYFEITGEDRQDYINAIKGNK